MNIDIWGGVLLLLIVGGICGVGIYMMRTIYGLKKEVEVLKAESARYREAIESIRCKFNGVDEDIQSCRVMIGKETWSLKNEFTRASQQINENNRSMVRDIMTLRTDLLSNRTGVDNLLATVEKFTEATNEQICELGRGWHDKFQHVCANAATHKELIDEIEMELQELNVRIGDVEVTFGVNVGGDTEGTEGTDVRKKVEIAG